MKNNPRSTCQQALDELMNRIEVESFDPAGLDQLCRQFPDCSQTLRSTYNMWQAIDEVEVPEPSQAMHTGFYKMLNEFQAETIPATKTRYQFDWWTWNGFSLKWAVIAGVFMLGVFSGTFFRTEDGGMALLENNEEKLQVEESYAMLTSSESASSRLQGIQMAKKMEHLDNRIIEALNQTLLNDPNVNVRLSAIETMLHFADNPQVRENLIRAIPHQTSPLIQMTLAEVMIALKDKRAIQEIRELLEAQQLELEVQMKMEETIETLL